ncbi:MAG: hypothetical protein K0Q43_301 [Ramlibacter sp.]|jgi:hypothetical protein|nr:hypothetical protein [Ramlibacter sp.]
MKIYHRPSHWVVVALVLAAFLLTLTEVHGQGREGTADASVAGATTDMTVRKGKEVTPQRDKSLAKDQRSAKKAVRGVKRSISRARHGTSPVDSIK